MDKIPSDSLSLKEIRVHVLHDIKVLLFARFLDQYIKVTKF